MTQPEPFIPQVSQYERRTLGHEACLVLSAERLAHIAASNNPTQASMCPTCGTPATGETVVSGLALFHAGRVGHRSPSLATASHDPGCGISDGVAECDCDYAARVQ